MLFIDSTYFQRDLTIPNVDEMNSVALTEVNQFIDGNVPFILNKALGYALYKDLIANTTNGALNVGAPQRWKDFVNGVEYTKDGKLVKWKGLIWTEGTFKGSLLADYVYCKYLEEMAQSFLSGVGEVKAAAKNAPSVNSTQRFVKIWNRFVTAYQGVYEDSGYTPAFYYHQGVPVIDWQDAQYDEQITLLQYLRDHETVYVDSAKSRFYEGIENQLGI